MALVLVVVNDFGNYRRGMQITNSSEINQIRSSEYAGQVVLVSDTIIPPPIPVDAPNYDELVAAYQQLVAQAAEQQAALDAAAALNTQQTAAISAQSQQINSLTNTVNVLAAKVDNPNGGTPTPPDTADDLPLAEADGKQLGTNSGAVLVGDPS